MTKKKPLTPELLAECSAANALFLAKKNELKLTQKKVADAAGISPAAVAQYLNGTNPLNAKFAVTLSRLIDEPVARFSHRLAAEIADMARTVSAPAEPGREHPQDAEHKESNVHAVDFSRYRATRACEILIPQYDVRASMGAGQELPSSYIDTIRHIAVSPDYLREAGVQYTAARNLAVITGFGESMHKTFSSGDPLIIDRGVNELITDGVYLFTLAGMLYIKRLQLLPGKVRMISDNDAFPPYDIQGSELGELIIHARVLLAWNARKL